MTIKEYAQSRGVSYEAVAKQVRKFKEKELKKHIKYNGNITVLDNYATDFLDRHRQPRNVVVAASDSDTQAELERLHNQVHQLQAELLETKTKVNTLLEEKILLVEDKAKNETLLKIADSEHEELERTRQQLQESERERERQQEQHQQELNKYKPTLFGLYRKTE